MNYANLFSLEKKKILLTGALGILGTEYVRALSAQGARVIGVDRETPENQSRARELIKEIGSEHLRVEFFDLAEIQKMPSWFSKLINEEKSIHGLINNAAIKSEGFFTPFLDFEEKDWSEVMRVNADAPFFLTQQVAKHFIDKNITGSILNVLSIYGLVGPHESIYEGSEYMGRAINTPPIYSASKGALASLTQYLASCLGKYQIRVNALTPGGVSSGQNSVFSEKYSAHCPMGRQARAHEMVGAVVYLMSDASTYVNGHNLVVDGGWTAW